MKARTTAGERNKSVYGTKARPALPPFYYLQNFELVLSAMLDRYPDLLAADELRFIMEFQKLARNSRALLARMVVRRGVLFKATSLQYPEIGDARTAAAPLVEAGWVNDKPLLHLNELQRLLTKAELIRRLNVPPRYGALRKADLIAMLQGHFTRPRHFADWCPGETDLVYSLLIAPMCERFRLLYFGNDRQGWSEFVTSDLRIFMYEKVERTLQSRPFQTRAQIELFRQLEECRDLLQAGMRPQDLLSLVPRTIEDCDWLEDRRQRILFLIARESERAGDRSMALTIYLDCRHRSARTRAIRLMARAGEWGKTRALCVAAGSVPESEAELQYIRRILPRANRRLGIPCDTPEVSPNIPEFEILLDGSIGTGAVEYHVRDHLARGLADGDTVRYVENGLINSLFGLLCWAAIFAPIPGAFFHDFHHGPADLSSGHFYARRRRHFEDCLAHLDSGRYRRVITATFREKWGIQSPFVRWYALDKSLLTWALDCFPAAHLRLWFEWILRDVDANRAGFPDLVQFWPLERAYRMIEVKGPGDRLQDNQRRLLEFCVSHGVPVAVCHVRRAGGGPSGGSARSAALTASARKEINPRRATTS